MIVFLLSGFWHGAGWTFIFWGFLHGLAIVMHRIWMNLNFKMNKFIAWFITFNFVNFAWIFFRAKSWDDAIKVLKGMLDIQNIVFLDKFATLFNYLNPFYFIEDISYNESKIIFDIHVLEMICVTLILTLLFKNPILLSFSNRNKIYYPIYCAFIFFVSVILISTSKYSEFIYFNF
jgi:algI